MSEFKFITPSEIVETTILGGNVDVDKYQFCIIEAQINVIEPMLGTELYDKVQSEAEAETLTGVYLTMYNDYVKPITKYKALSAYLTLAPFKVDNGGVFVMNPSNAEPASESRISTLQSRYDNLAQSYVIKFNKFISLNELPEYKTWQDEVNATKIEASTGWFFGEDEIDIRGYNDCNNGSII